MKIYDKYLEEAPGLILGPYEALIAMIAWLHEALPKTDYGRYGPGPIGKLSVSARMKDQLLIAYLLYGKFDAYTMLASFDHYLAGKGFRESRRELVGDFLLSLKSRSPFSHSLERGSFWPLLQSQPKLDSIDERKIISSCFKALNRAGVIGYEFPGEETIPLRTRLHQAMSTINYCNDKGMSPGPYEAESTILRLLYAIDRSVDFQIPFFSRDVAAPAWIRKDIHSESSIVSVLLEEVDWLPRPRTFMEASTMAQDERLVGLRTYIKGLMERIAIGNLDFHRDLREQIRKDVKSFRSKPWASRIGKFIAYVAVPAEIVGLFCNSHIVGISVASLGATSEWLATICSKRKSKHWLSMSKLPQYSK